MNKFVKKTFALCLAAGVAAFSFPAFADGVPYLADSSFETVTSESGLSIANPVFTTAEDGGDVVTSLSGKAGETLFANIKMSADGAECDVTAVTAVYDGEGIMQSICMANKHLSANDGQTLTYAVTLPSDFDDNCKVKTYVMDSLSGMWSYCKTFEFSSDGGRGTAWTLGDDWKIQSEDSYDGMSSLKLTPNTVGSKAVGYIDASADKSYRMSFMSKGTAPFYVSSADELGNTFTAAKEIYPDSDWSEQSYMFSTSEDGRTALCFEGGNGGDASFVDYIKILDNFMINGGFENGSNGWNLSGSDAYITSEDKSEGANSLAIKSSSVGVGAETEAEVVADKTFILSFKTKCADKVTCYVADGGTILAETTIDPTSTWKDCYLAVETKGRDKVTIGFKSPRALSRMSYVDDVRLVSPEYSGIMINGDFEDGTTRGWSQVAGSAAEAGLKLIAVTDEVYSGTYALHAERDEVYSFLYYEMTDKVKEAGSGLYYCGVWIKPTNGGIPVASFRAFYNNSSLNTTPAWYGIKGLDEWQYVCGVLDVKEAGDLKQLRFVTYTGSGNADRPVGDYYVDDVSIVKIK